MHLLIMRQGVYTGALVLPCMQACKANACLALLSPTCCRVCLTDDEQFKEEKAVIIKEISMLESPNTEPEYEEEQPSMAATPMSP